MGEKPQNFTLTVEGIVVNADSVIRKDGFELWDSIGGIRINIFVGGVKKAKLKTDSEGSFFIKAYVSSDDGEVKLVFVDPDGEFDKKTVPLGRITQDTVLEDQVVLMSV